LAFFTRGKPQQHNLIYSGFHVTGLPGMISRLW